MLSKILACTEGFRIAGKGGNPRSKKLRSNRLKLCTDLLNFFLFHFAQHQEKLAYRSERYPRFSANDSEEGLQGKNLHEFNRKAEEDQDCSLLEFAPEKDILLEVWFSDESWFYIDGIAQKNNQYFWAFNKDTVEPIESQLTPLKVMVWAAVSSKGLIGPYSSI